MIYLDSCLHCSRIATRYIFILLDPSYDTFKIPNYTGGFVTKSLLLSLVVKQASFLIWFSPFKFIFWKPFPYVNLGMDYNATCLAFWLSGKMTRTTKCGKQWKFPFCCFCTQKCLFSTQKSQGNTVPGSLFWLSRIRGPLSSARLCATEDTELRLLSLPSGAQ